MNTKSKLINGVIYKFQNKLNNKIYIGQSREEKRRYERHVNCKEPLYELDRAIKCYGIENFTYEIIESFESYNIDEVNNWMDEREEYYIKEFNSLYPNGYNLLSSKKHPEFSEITKQRISESITGEKNGFYGKKHSEESRKKMSISAKKRGNNHPNFVKTQEMIDNWKISIKKYYENLTDKEKIEISNNQKKRYKQWKDSLTEEEYNEWNKNRIKKSSETKQRKFKEGTLICSTKGKKAINNGIIGKKVLPEEVDKYLQNGWKLGALWNKKK